MFWGDTIKMFLRFVVILHTGGFMEPRSKSSTELSAQLVQLLEDIFHGENVIALKLKFINLH
uniref:Uncharacterized protein n=1 Tax=Anguilla anguilla TaxID=7936 RepID=A0A0E9VVQ3_ANGAN